MTRTRLLLRNSLAAAGWAGTACRERCRARRGPRARPLPAPFPATERARSSRGARPAHGALSCSGSRRDAPDRVADVVGDQQRAARVDARRRPGGRARCRRSSRKPVSTSSGVPRRPAARERHEDHLVAARRLAVPRAVLADERAAAIALRQQLAVVEREPERRGVRAERVVGHDRLRDQVGPRRLDALVDVLAVVAVRPAVEAAVAAPTSCSRARGRCRARRAR